MMKPEKKTTATMKTTPATMPIHAAAAVRRLRRGGSTYAGGEASGGGVGVATGRVAGSEDDVVSLMHLSMQTISMCLS
jgi:hypothetical protein